MTRKLAACFVTCWIATAACSPGGTRAFHAVFRDSAGIRIVENAAPAANLALWSAVDSGFLQIGVVDGEPAYQFYHITGALETSDGQIVVANSGTSELRLYSRDGRLLRTVGGSGDGPGEYRYLRSIFRLAGDSIVAVDAIARRVTLYSPDGSLVRTWPLVELGPFTAPPPVARLSDGRWLTITSRTVGRPPDPVEFISLLVTYPGATHSADTVAEVPSGPGLFKACGVDLRSMCRVNTPFPLQARIAVGQDRVYGGNGERFEVRVISSTGILEGIWRVEWSRRVVTSTDLARDKAALLASAPNDEVRRQLAVDYDEAPAPEAMPAYSGLVVDVLGNLWAEEYHTSYDGEKQYLVFSSMGEVIARIQLPSNLNITEIGADYVLGVWKDDSGVEFIREYSLRK